jgi:hypothetical protein
MSNRLRELLNDIDKSKCCEDVDTTWEVQDVLHYLRTEQDPHRLFIWASLYCEKYDSNWER